MQRARFFTFRLDAARKITYFFKDGLAWCAKKSAFNLAKLKAGLGGRGKRIRTFDPLVPNQVR